VSPIIHTPEGSSAPIELGEGRGDLRFSSVPFSQWDGDALFADRPVSYARIFADQPWIAIAVMRLLTWSVRVPLKVYRRTDDDGGRVRLRPSDHPLAAAIATPWDRGYMAALVTALLGPLFVHGNGLTDVQEGAGGRIRFEPVDWRTVKPIRLVHTDVNAEIVGWEVHRPEAGPDHRSADTVMHLKWWSPLGRLGISPLRQLRSTLTAEAAALDWNMNHLYNAARPSGVIEIDKEFLGIEKEKRQALLDQLAADVREAYSGPRNAGRVPLLPPGLHWETTPHTTAVEAALIEQRKVNREEAAAIYMLPPPMVGILDHATYSNVEQARGMAYTDGLAPPLIITEQTMNAHVCSGLLRDDEIFVEFDFGGILRGDRLKEIQAIREAVNTGVLTPNEGRDLTGRPRVETPAADKLYLPTNNLRPIDEPDGGRARDTALAAQQFGNAVEKKILTREEARGELGYGPNPALDDEAEADAEDTEGST